MLTVPGYASAVAQGSVDHDGPLTNTAFVPDLRHLVEFNRADRGDRVYIWLRIRWHTNETYV